MEYFLHNFHDALDHSTHNAYLNFMQTNNQYVITCSDAYVMLNWCIKNSSDELTCKALSVVIDYIWYRIKTKPKKPIRQNGWYVMWKKGDII